VTLVSGDPASLTVVDVVVPDNATTVLVPVTALLQATDVTVTASLANVFGLRTQAAHVRVLAEAEAPAAVTLSAPTSSIRAGASLTITATLDIPALVDTVIPLTLTPSTAGTLPASVTVPANQLSATVTYTDQLVSGPIQITTTFGAGSTLALNATSSATHLVISQVYGGGGNAGAVLKNDFIEIHNPLGTPVSLAGMSVQYVSAGGTTGWSVTPLVTPAGGEITVPPGGYVLVQEAAGAAGTVDLPVPDVIGTIAMGAGAGKVALVPSTTALIGCATSTAIDFIGYGTGLNCSEGSGAPALSATLAAFRKDAGCTDTDSNGADFTAAAPVPRNGATTAVVCQ
jgi:hypothetical protein